VKTCKICKVEKELIEFNPASKYKDKIYYRGECKECNLKKQSSDQSAQIKYRNSEYGRKVKSDYKKTDKYKEYSSKYEKERYLKDPNRRKKIDEWTRMKLDTDPIFRMRHNLRNRVRGAFKAKKWHKDNSISKYIGCRLDELKIHIESKFTEGMTWENYGEWEIDHIYPLSLAKTEEEMYTLCIYTNLQPLWRKDNIKKSNKI
jgi:hypothetical protein